jgi:quercetin dioxygenase-like cupin family protein
MGSDDRDSALAQLAAEGLLVTEWTDAPGVVYPEHVHPDREVRVVLEGSMIVGVDEASHELGPGDRIELEPGVSHWARVGPDGVTYLAGTTVRPGSR